MEQNNIDTPELWPKADIDTTMQQEVDTLSNFMHGNEAQPVPAQNQLPADSYIYANTSHIGGVIQTVAEQYAIDPHKLEALTSTIRNKQAHLSGFYNMQIGYYPGMSAESLVQALGRVADLSNTISDRKKQEAQLNGTKYESTGLDELVDSLQSIDGKKSGKMYYQEALTAIQEADHMKFDTSTLSEYYETLIRSGVSKAEAWTRTMQQQDLYRQAQDERAIKQDFDAMVTPQDMETYTASLYTKVQQSSNPDERIRLYAQYQTASKLTKTYAAAFKADPAAYIQSKDPTLQGVIANAQKTGDFSAVVSSLDAYYDRLGTPASQRKYLTQEQLKSTAKEINTFLGSDPIKAQATLVSLSQAYGKNAGKVINQLINEGHVDASASVLIEAIRTNSPASNDDVINMLKNKMAYKSDYAKTMLGAPDNKTANIMRQKLEARVYDLPGYKTLVNQLNLSGNVAGKIRMAQYYADMALFYKYKHPNVSDKQAVEMVQKNLIDSIYTYDAQGRIILPKTSISGRPIQYNTYTPEQAKNYFVNRKFVGQNIQIGNIPTKTSETMLSNTSKIYFRTLDDGRTVQPVYDDGNGTVQALFVGTGKNRKVLKFDLRQLGNDDILGVIDARKSARKLYGILNDAANLPAVLRMAAQGIPMDSNSAAAIKSLNELGFDLRNLDTTKPFSQQFDRTNMSPRRVAALNTMLVKLQAFETALDEYERLKKDQRTAASPRINTLNLINPFNEVMYAPGQPARFNALKKLEYYNKEAEELKPALKRKRIELYKLEDEILQEAGIFLNYKGPLPVKPLTKQINEHALIDKVLWGGY